MIVDWSENFPLMTQGFQGQCFVSSLPCHVRSQTAFADAITSGEFHRPEVFVDCDVTSGTAHQPVQKQTILCRVQHLLPNISKHTPCAPHPTPEAPPKREEQWRVCYNPRNERHVNQSVSAESAANMEFIEFGSNILQETILLVSLTVLCVLKVFPIWGRTFLSKCIDPHCRL